MTSTSTLAAASLMCNMFARSRHRRPKLRPGLGYLTFWVIGICNRVPRQDDAHLWAASCCRCRRCCRPVATFSSTFSLSTPHFSLGQQNILRHDMIYMKCRLDAHFYYIFVAVSAPLPPPSAPLMRPLLAGSALILCYAPRHGKGNSCARHDKG